MPYAPDGSNRNIRRRRRRRRRRRYKTDFQKQLNTATFA
jgi:hypothetical protein